LALGGTMPLASWQGLGDDAPLRRAAWPELGRAQGLRLGDCDNAERREMLHLAPRLPIAYVLVR
jgi:hypothetical protein